MAILFFCVNERKSTFQVTKVVVIGDSSKLFRPVYEISDSFFPAAVVHSKHSDKNFFHP